MLRTTTSLKLGLRVAKQSLPKASMLNMPLANKNFICRSLATFDKEELDATTHVHFRASSRPHPLQVKPKDIRGKATADDIALGDHSGRQQNHIWTADELSEKMSKLYHYQPKTITDHIMNKVMFGLYHAFNFMTGYTPVDPTVRAMEWRLILLESIAGVPGFVAAGFRHFRSLRRLQRDHGWIATLLEEAENERMHLLICLSTFKAGSVTRSLVVAAQYVMTPLLMTIYLIKPKAMHRFVGYLEETACKTYVNTIHHVETPGTKLHAAWAQLPAPPLAVGYYHLPEGARWVDTLKCMMADEANHRDVNHTFADMQSDDPNPFIEHHKQDAAFAWRLHLEGEPAFTQAEIIQTKAPATQTLHQVGTDNNK